MQPSCMFWPFRSLISVTASSCGYWSMHNHDPISMHFFYLLIFYFFLIKKRLEHAVEFRWLVLSFCFYFSRYMYKCWVLTCLLSMWNSIYLILVVVKTIEKVKMRPQISFRISAMQMSLSTWVCLSILHKIHYRCNVFCKK